MVKTDVYVLRLASAPTDADVCADRCGRLRRPMRMSASTDADVCVDRCRCLRRPMRMAEITLI
ncbi:hypothetical protein [Leyella stercorea]|uniref:hypothetical protein n=1 Tax=Leyella stercorea TaxID=363265 RepID=UPI003AAD260E